MRKHRAALHVTFYSDSRTVEAYVEREGVNGRWELMSDASSSSSSTCLELFGELLEWLEETMGAGYPSMNPSSDLG